MCEKNGETRDIGHKNNNELGQWRKTTKKGCHRLTSLIYKYRKLRKSDLLRTEHVQDVAAAQLDVGLAQIVTAEEVIDVDGVVQTEVVIVRANRNVHLVGVD